MASAQKQENQFMQPLDAKNKSTALKQTPQMTNAPSIRRF
jgi:hypothetical protein